MSTPHSLHHALLRPCIIHILRAAGYHTTRPSVLDTLTDFAARYILLISQTAAAHAALNSSDPELALEVSITDIRMAMQDCGVLPPERLTGEDSIDGQEDLGGVDDFLAWVKGPGNREIRRIALEGSDGAKEDYLTALKKKHSTSDDDTRYNGTILGNPTEPRMVKVEGGEVTSIKEWKERLINPPVLASEHNSSTRQSSALSSLGDEPMLDMDMDF